MAFNPSAFDQNAFDPDAFDFAAAGPVFIGPPIENLTLVIGVPMTPRDYSGRFSSGLPMTFAMSAGSALPAGLSLSSAGVLSGTPTVLGTASGEEVEATDSNGSALSNAFSITVQNAPPARANGQGLMIGIRIGV